MTPVYIFSGLGTDERVFQFINFSGFSVHYIKWITPLKKETIYSYAKRLTSQIQTDKPILIGVSFGGIMAVEVAKIITTNKIIIISSAKRRQELPFYYQLAGAFSLHKLLPAGLFKLPNYFTYWLFGIKKQAEKQLLANILQDTDKHFIKWAIDKVVHWQNKHLHPNLLHIHGTDDKILPYRLIRNAIPIKNGGHFMIVDKADSLTAMLRSMLS